MKRIWLIPILVLTLLLSSCGAEQTALPADWETDWTVVGPLLAVELLDGFELNESNDALYLSGIYYATWVTGEAREHTNEESESANIYDGQIYVLLQEFRDQEAAETEVGIWQAREKQTYETGEISSVACGDQDFEIIPLLSGSESNPYSKGIAAFAVRGKWAICVEFLCADSFDTELQATLEAFLNGFHYSE